MRKIIKILSVLLLINTGVLGVNGCSNTINYYDDRTTIQKQDANFLLNMPINLNPDKHVLLIGLDGVPFHNLSPQIVNDSVFKANYYIENYETIKGWSSIFWGNIVKHNKDIFSLIKDNNQALKTANITQWMGSYYHGAIYDQVTDSNIDFEKDLADQSAVANYDTVNKMQHCFTDLLDWTNQVINQNYNFIFMYNAFFDELKHKYYADNNSLIEFLLNSYYSWIENFYHSLNSKNWLIIATTDHSRNADSFNHSNSDINAHFSWTLANNDLESILGHSYTNFYDIRTVVLKWLSK